MLLNLIVTAAFGLESVVAEELRRLGYHGLKVDNGTVEFSGDYAATCRTNLSLRSAEGHHL